MIGVPTILRKSDDLRQDWPETLLLLGICFTAARTSSQYDDIFKLIIENHEEHCKILKTEEQSNDEDYFEDVDQRVFIFKHKVPNWLKDTKDMIRNQSHLEEVQRVDLQKNLQDHQDQAKLLSHES